MTKEEVIKILKCLLGEEDSPLTDEQCEDEEFVASVYDEAIRVAIKALEEQPEKLYTKADYIMALHKEYGCSLTRAKEAHNKALEYLQEEVMMKGGKNETGII